MRVQFPLRRWRWRRRRRRSPSKDPPRPPYQRVMFMLGFWLNTDTWRNIKEYAIIHGHGFWRSTKGSRSCCFELFIVWKSFTLKVTGRTSTGMRIRPQKRLLQARPDLTRRHPSEDTMHMDTKGFSNVIWRVPKSSHTPYPTFYLLFNVLYAKSQGQSKHIYSKSRDFMIRFKSFDLNSIMGHSIISSVCNMHSQVV